MRKASRNTKRIEKQNGESWYSTKHGFHCSFRHFLVVQQPSQNMRDQANNHTKAPFVSLLSPPPIRRSFVTLTEYITISYISCILGTYTIFRSVDNDMIVIRNTRRIHVRGKQILGGHHVL
jgi:hypothetical protein